MNEYLTEDNNINAILKSKEPIALNDLIYVIPPYSENYKNIFVPQRFEDTIICHIISLYLSQDAYYNPPIYLAIKGDAGEGKTAQTIATCTQKGCFVIYISASVLSGSHENEAKEKLQKIYDYALQLRMKNLTAIVIDDFHKGIVNEDVNIKKTINTNILIGYMMNLAEHNGSAHVPIILTANDLSNVYAPLLRNGRADLFLWKPSFDEKRDIVHHILSSFISEKDESAFNKFFKKYSNQNVAFFSQLKNAWRKELLKQLIHKVPNFDNTNLIRINSLINSYKLELTYADLNKLADTILKEREI